MPTKCCWVIHGSLTSERKASTSPSSFINHSTRPCCSIERSSAKLLVFTMSCTSKFERWTGSDVGSTRRRGNHMHDHSRFQRDINDVTGVSLSLSLSQKSLTHNIGSASALPIMLYMRWQKVTWMWGHALSRGRMVRESIVVPSF